MLMYQHKAPHRNWQPGPEWLDKYDDVTIPEPDTLFDDYQGRGTAAKTQDMTIAKTMNASDLKLTPPRNLTPEQAAAWNKAYGPKNEAFRKANLQGKDLVRWKYQRYMKDYLRCIAAVDDNLGRVLEYLDDTGLADNTVVIYSSDQGFYLGEHGWFDKRWMYEESLADAADRPLARRGSAGKHEPGYRLEPGFRRDVPGHRRSGSPRRHAGAQPRAAAAGPDAGRLAKDVLLPLLRVPGGPQRAAPLRRADGRYKLIHFYPHPWDPAPIDEWELYDLKSDPEGAEERLRRSGICRRAAAPGGRTGTAPA